jgi:hypothetical protein
MSSPIIILYVIIGAGALILCAAGIAHTVRVQEPDVFMPEEQRAHLRAVRERNMEALAATIPRRENQRPWAGR